MTLSPGISVVMPVHPPRFGTTLDDALRSVWEQTRAVDGLHLMVDGRHEGPAVVRNRGLAAVRTQWTAFVDSDDLLRPQHLDRLWTHGRESGADLVYPHFDILMDGQTRPDMDPFADRFGKPFDPDLLRVRNTIPVTVLVRTDVIRDVGGFTPKGGPDNPCEDWGCWEKMLAAGAVFSHLPERTWLWRWHRSETDANTGGRIW